jgi:pimeloyl-ACP methyl ester carboxylesterase
VDCPAIDYATTVDGLSIAYQRFGSGEFDVVYLPGTVSHLEMAWQIDGMHDRMERFASFCRFLKFDKRGTGLSDRHMGTGTPEARIDDVRAVMDAEGIERAMVLGHSEGGTLAALFAAIHPERVDRLVLYNAYCYGPLCRDHPKPAAGRRVAETMLDRRVGELHGAEHVVHERPLDARCERRFGLEDRGWPAVHIAAPPAHLDDGLLPFGAQWLRERTSVRRAVLAGLQLPVGISVDADRSPREGGSDGDHRT